ncbi:MAG: hypothetical protein FWD06_03205 [Oscillospiraceae bacterium]|nr:hypothetical protein [Oscillospiraceae bacterium]
MLALGLGFIAHGHFYLGNTVAGWGFTIATIAALIPLLAILLMWLISAIFY